MKKSLSVIILALMLSACGGGGNDSDEIPDAAGPTVPAINDIFSDGKFTYADASLYAGRYLYFAPQDTCSATFGNQMPASFDVSAIAADGATITNDIGDPINLAATVELELPTLPALPQFEVQPQAQTYSSTNKAYSNQSDQLIYFVSDDDSTIAALFQTKNVGEDSVTADLLLFIYVDAYGPCFTWYYKQSAYDYTGEVIK